MRHSLEQLTGSILRRKNIKRDDGGKELSSEKLTPRTVMRSDAPSYRTKTAGWSNFLTLRIPRNVMTSCGNFKSYETRASTTWRARLLRSNENRVANSKHTSLARLSRVIRKNTGGSLTRKGRKEGREHEAETQRVKRQTVDSRGLRREQKRKEGGRKGGSR